MSDQLATGNKKKLNVFLIYPPTTVFWPNETIPAAQSQLGLGYLASYLREYLDPSIDLTLGILDCAIEGLGVRLDDEERQCSRYGLSEEDILARLEAFKPDIVGITSMWTAYATDAHDVARLIKDNMPDTKVIVGGTHASIQPRMTILDDNIDVVAIGEGEVTFLELVTKMARGEDYSEVLGTALKLPNGEIKENARRPLIEDLDTIPFPARDLMNMKKYFEVLKSPYLMRTPMTSVFSSRGCPYKCNFCSIHSVWERKWRKRSPKNVADELEHLIKDYGVREVSFLDDNLSVNRKRLHGICDEIIERKLDFKWSTPNGTAYWTLDKDVLKKMKQAGCYRLTFGVESGCPETRSYMQKNVSLKKAETMCKEANRLGMWTISTYIIGFPYETKEQILQSLEFAITSGTDWASFYLLMPFIGTGVYEDFKKEGLLNFDAYLNPSEHDENVLIALSAILSQGGTATTLFTAEELKALQTRMTKKFVLNRVLNPTAPLRVLSKVRSFEDLQYLRRIVVSFLHIMKDLLRNRYSLVSSIHTE
ncbi:MAG: radical SAM protein [bacterium]|nr:radical SAM protein [bacterium]